MARSLVVPMYQEESRIGASIAELATSSLNRDDVEFIFVDDGSSDSTVATVERVCPEAGLRHWRLLKLAHRGKGAAVRAGMLAAKGRAVAFTDADLSTRPAEIERCFSIVEAGECEVALASRSVAGSTKPVRQPRFRELGGRGVNLGLRVLGLTRFKDTQCGLKVFSQAAAREVFGEVTVDGFAFDVEALLLAGLRGYRMCEVPVVWSHVEESRVSPLADGVRTLLDAASLRWKHRARARR